MIRALAIALVLMAGTAFASGKAKKKQKKAPPPPAAIVHPFADVPLAKLSVVDTRGQQAVVESKPGDAVVLVRAGDKLGEEGFEVVKVTRGCLTLKGPEAVLTLCADVPEVPAT